MRFAWMAVRQWFKQCGRRGRDETIAFNFLLLKNKTNTNKTKQNKNKTKNGLTKCSRGSRKPFKPAVWLALASNLLYARI